MPMYITKLLYFKIEIVTGIHPYAQAKGPFDLSTMILQNESPTLDLSRFSQEFCSFVDLWCVFRIFVFQKKNFFFNKKLYI